MAAAVPVEVGKAAQLCVFILGSGTLASVYLDMCLRLGMRQAYSSQTTEKSAQHFQMGTKVPYVQHLYAGLGREKQT